MAPTVSINLCCYNSEPFLEETLQSVFAQTFTDWELVVVNDGSTDGTERIIQAHQAAGRPIVYHAQANAGLGAARNKAIELSQGEFIAIIDHDDLWTPLKLERQMALFAGRPQVGLVYTNAAVRYPDGRLRPYTELARVTLHRGQMLLPLVLNDFIVCSSILLRRQTLDEVGWLNPAFVQAEEYDLLLRVAERHEFDYTPEPLTIYRLHSGNSSWNLPRLRQESAQIVGALLARQPSLVPALGPNLTRLRRTGLSCSPGRAALLRGDLASARQWYQGWLELLGDVPRLLVVYSLAFFPSAWIDTILTNWGKMRKSNLLRPRHLGL